MKDSKANKSDKKQEQSQTKKPPDIQHDPALKELLKRAMKPEKETKRN